MPGVEDVIAQVSGPGLAWLDRLSSWVRRVTDVGSEVEDSEEVRLRKGALTLLVIRLDKRKVAATELHGVAPEDGSRFHVRTVSSPSPSAIATSRS